MPAYELLRVRTHDGQDTTVYLTRHPRAATRVSVVHFPVPERLDLDSDITAERHPRCAFGIGDGELLVVCCDGRRTGVDAGLGLGELARLLNRPYSDQDQPAPESRPVVAALALDAA